MKAQQSKALDPEKQFKCRGKSLGRWRPEVEGLTHPLDTEALAPHHFSVLLLPRWCEGHGPDCGQCYLGPLLWGPLSRVDSWIGPNLRSVTGWRRK